MKYHLEEIWTDLNDEFHLLKNQDKIKKCLTSIVETVNYDLEHMYLRPYSHNVISAALRYIEQASTRKVPVWIMGQIPAIQFIFKIQVPEPQESHGEPRTK